MATRRRRFARFVLLLAVLAVALLLLEMNRFFPGVWPGGGGDTGIARRDDARSPHPDRVRPPDTPAPPVEPGVPTVRVRVAAADGTPVEKASLGGRGGGDAHVLEAGAGRVPEAAVRAGFEVEAAGAGRLAHAGPSRAVGDDWDVRLPREPLPPAPSVTNRTVRVLSGDATGAGGAPVAGARLAVTLPDGGEQSLVADADGTATLPDVPGTFRVCAEAEGHGETCVYATVRRADPTTIVLPTVRDVETAFRDEDGAPLRARTLRLVGDSGATKTLPPRDDGHESFRTRVAATQAESLEVEVDGRPPVRVPLARLGETTTVPRGRTLRVRATDESGSPVANARVAASFSPETEVEGSASPPLRVSATTGADGEARLAVPAERAADVLVESDALAPAALRAGPDAADPVEARLSPGVRVPVRVLDAQGKPLPDARVSLLARAGGASARRDGATDAEGRVDLPPVAAGSAEVYAHCRGCAWGSARVEVAPSMAPVEIRLSPGVTLRLVVEDPRGLPLEGVRVRSAARADREAGRAEAVGPDEPPWRTDDHGTLVVDDLPDREVDLYLSKPGYGDEVLGRVRPGAATVFATLVPSR